MSQRQAKVESFIRHQVATELSEQLPIFKAQVTVTGVDVAPDLRNATVWLSLLAGSASPDEILAQIDELRPGVQRGLASHMATKFVPKLHFKYDKGAEHAGRIDDLLREL